MIVIELFVSIYFHETFLNTDIPLIDYPDLTLDEKNRQ